MTFPIIFFSIAASGCSDAAPDGGSSGGRNGEASSGSSGGTGGSSGEGGEAPGNTGGNDSGGTSSSEGTAGSAGAGGEESRETRCARWSLPERDGAEIYVEPAGPGKVLVGGEETTLRAVVSAAESGDTILLEDGTYTFDESSGDDYTGVYMTTADVTLRGASGDPNSVTLDSAYVNHNEQTAPITVAAPGVALAHFTVKRSIFHLIHLWEEGDDTLIFDVTLEDGGQQFLKASPGSGTVDDVSVACSRFVMTEAGRDNVWGYGPQDGNTTCYTGGIDTHDARDWTVVGNSFTGIYCDTDGGRPAHGKEPEARDNQTYAGGLAEHAIHMWNAESGHGHLIEGNRVLDCARGIGLGLADPVFDTRIVNNMVTSHFPGSREHDVGIIVERGSRVSVLHNTVITSHPDAYPNSIEIRWDVTSEVEVAGNLTVGAVALRDGAAASIHDNTLVEDLDLFVDPQAGNLHLASCDDAPTISASLGVAEDYDGEPRTAASHAGADECIAP